jgi:hypothetical protein
MENWKAIEGYEGLYEISNYGRVKSLSRPVIDKNGVHVRTTDEIFKKPQVDTRGYYRVQLSKNNKHKTHKVHRLVAQAFIPNPENKRDVNHIDAVKTNNFVDNLGWVTNAENIAHAQENKLSYRLRKPVGQYDLNGNLLKTYESAYATRQDGFSERNVSSCCNGYYGCKTYKKFIWKYL